MNFAWCRSFVHRLTGSCFAFLQTRSLAALAVALEKTAGIGARIDIKLTIIRIGFFFADHALVEEYLPKADA